MGRKRFDRNAWMRPDIRSRASSRIAPRLRAQPRGSLRGPWWRLSERLRGSEGFTIVEVLVAAIVLASGLLTAMLALSVGVKTSYVTRARVGAINLEREVSEDARSIPYGQLTNSSVVSQLQAMPGLANQGAPGTWQITRRGVTYTVTATESDIAAVGGKSVAQKQVTVGVSWRVEGSSHSISEVSTISNLASGNALPTGLELLTPFVSTQPQITNASTTQLTFQVTVPSGTTGVVWTVNGQQCQIVGSNTTSPCTVSSSGTTVTSPTWNISGLSDGTYYVGAAAVDSTGAVGPSVRIPVQLIRGAPSAPTVTDYGFNPNLFTSAGTQSIVGELRWISSPEANVIGYDIFNPSGTLLCQILNSGTYPASCGQNAANIWCERGQVAATSGTSSSTWNCIDLSPSASDTSSLTYKIAALYYDSTGAVAAGPSTTATLQPIVRPAYNLMNTTANTTSNCTTPAHDMNTTSPGATSSSVQFGATTNFCSDVLSVGGPFNGGLLTVYLTNPGSQTCPVGVYLNFNSFTFGAMASATVNVPAAAGAVWKATITIAPSSIVTATAGSRVNLTFAAGSGCGSNKNAPSVFYGSTTYPSQFATSAIVPAAPSNFSVTTNSDGSATLQWSAPSSGAPVSFYRVYRGGQLYTNRYDIVSASSYDSDTGDGCQWGFFTGWTCTYHDVNRPSPPYTYYVTAVGATTAGYDMAESPMTSGASG